jgi:hypothetical protein
MLKPVFKNADLEYQMNENGYVVIPGFLPHEVVHELLALYKKHHNESEAGCWNSIYDLPTGEGKPISDAITAVVTPYLDKYFKDFKFPAAIFIVKNPYKGHESLVHRDDSMHNEREVEYRQCWVPLVDITETNGTLYVVPRSHKLFTDERPMFAPWQHKVHAPRLEKEFVNLYPKAGDLVVYFDKTLHGSYKNESTETRPVFQGGVMHKEAEPLFTRYNPANNMVESYAVDPDFFFSKEYMQKNINPRYPLVKTEPYQPQHVSAEEVDAFFKTTEGVSV